jgi:Uncharacterised nucleotidyltransferase
LSSHPDLIVRSLLYPQITARLTPIEWDLLIRQARVSVLLARLGDVLQRENILTRTPASPKAHLHSALLVSQKQDHSLQWEVQCLTRELSRSKAKIILLKGAAYAALGLNVAKGRMFSDIDILVPKAILGDVERDLLLHGWQNGHHDEYDQRYFRKWMHEIPPLMHRTRGTTIDVHHTILPESARIKVNTPALFESLVPITGRPNVYVLQPTDMLLHSATHLFHEGNFEKGLRDLFDLDALLREFGAETGFWDALVPRAITLGLTRPLYYALRFTSAMLATPVPSEITQAAMVGRPSKVVGKIMDACYLRAFRPMHPSTASFGNWLARFALYVRSHWIRMPFHLLAIHLGRKALLPSKKIEDEAVIEKALQADKGVSKT